ncbi:short chain oxidoreductase [Imleria badia]|nr:short chain oxidoreductase [Imleria badia]
MRAAIVTGCARGIGRAIALQLAKDGYSMALNDLPSSIHLLNDLKRDLADRNPDVKSIITTGDVTREIEVQRMVDETEHGLGGLDVMIANAGTCFAKSFIDTSAEELEHMLNLNVRGTHLCMRAAARVMIAQGRGGRIVTASSIAGYRGAALFSAYSASKFAIKGLTQSLALEVGKHGITVNSYAPGSIDTPLLHETAAQYAELMKGSDINTAHGCALRTIGQPTDVAALVSFLVSERGQFITGQTIACDGGIF